MIQTLIQTQYLILWSRNSDQYDKSGTAHFKLKNVH